MTILLSVGFAPNGYLKRKFSLLNVKGRFQIFIKSNLPQSVVDVTSPLQAIVVKVTLHTTITFCNLYIPPSTALHLRDLTHLGSQLPKPFMIVGDFNSHN